MKDTIRLSILALGVAGLMAAASMIRPSYATPSVPLTSEEISWTEFCKARGYDIHDESDEVINEFLDTWVGSVEEERVFNNLPAQEV